MGFAATREARGGTVFAAGLGLHARAAESDVLVEFAGVVGATTDDKLGYLRRTKGGSNWKQAGAYSARAITKVDDEVRGVSADCATNNKRVMFGLTNNAADKDHDFNSIDFAIYCDQQHTRAIVYERGQKKAVIGSFASGETFQVALNDEGAVEYYKDGELAYTSANAPAFPMYVDVALHTNGVVLENVRWVKSVVSSPE